MKKRESFNTRWGFILACIGSAVGMGNIWMFPTRVSMYGGGSFIIPYIFFVILISSTGVIGEMCFGRATRSGPINAFGTACDTSGNRRIGEFLGIIPVLGSFALAVGYTVVMGWLLKYTWGTFNGFTLSFHTVDEYSNAFGSMASSFGNNLCQIIALLIAAFILIFGVGKGIENANKILMPLFFLLFIGLGIYTSFQPGASDGYRYIFQIDGEALAKPSTWIYALGQAFFSLSVAGNGTLIYGSYLSDKENIPSSAGRVALFDTLAACLAALVIIPAMATSGAQLDQGGPGLMFIFLPNLLSTMPGGSVFAIVFFVAVFFAGLTSLINLYETPIATLQEKFELNRVHACLIVIVLGLISSLCIQGIVSAWMDVLSIYICPLGAGLAAIMFFWVCGQAFVNKHINIGRDKPYTNTFYYLGKYVFTPLCFLVLIFGMLFGGIG